jgi:flap endonuclease-1
MGVNKFFKIRILNENSRFFNYNLEDTGLDVKLNELKGKTIYVDASLIIYQSLATKHLELMDANNNVTNHLKMVFYLICNLTQSGINQIWIFDNKNRNTLKSARQTKIEKIGDKIKECKKLLNIMGVNYITSPAGYEAEELASCLVFNGYGNYVLSTDSDVLMFGGNLLRICYKDKVCDRLIKPKNDNINHNNKSSFKDKKQKCYKLYYNYNIRKHLGVTQDELVKICMILGTDFNTKIKGIGIATIMEKYKDVKMSDEFDYIFKFLIKNRTFDVSTIMFDNTDEEIYHRKKVIEFLTSKNFNKTTLKSWLNNYEKNLLSISF